MTKRIAYTLLTAGAFGLLLSSASAQDSTKEEIASGMQKFEYTRHVPTGIKRPLEHIASVNPDCSLVEGMDVRKIAEPEHGAVEIERAEGFISYAKDNVRAKCNDKKVRVLSITYQSKPGYVGRDEFGILILYPSGYAREVHYSIVVH
jgi:hypothetical protein